MSGRTCLTTETTEGTMPKFESSIVIPVYNKWDLTRKCLKSIAANTDTSKVEVIVIDNASSDATQQGCAFLGAQLFGDAFRYVRNEVNRNFAGASNQGAELARGEFLIFLNNDTEVQPGWYQPLLNDFTEYPDIAATGPLLLYPDETPLGRTVQHLGVFITPFYNLGHLHQGIPAASPLARKRRFFQAITAACLVIRKHLFMEVGQFDERFVNGFEDVDLCARLREKGCRMTVNPDAVVIHHESQTHGRHAHEEDNSRVLAEKSLHLLIADWHRQIRDDGLELKISKWQILRVTMPEKARARLDPLAGSMSTDQLKELVIAHPYWEAGLFELARRSRDSGERAFFCKTYLDFFRVPEAAFKLSRIPWVMWDKAMLGTCAARMRSHLTPPASHLETAHSVRKWCVKLGPSEFVEQCNAFIRDYDKFRDCIYPEMARGLWQLEHELGMTHNPDDARAYTLWRYAVDARARRDELADFSAAFTANPEAFPAISILMPVYNPRPEHLRAALESVLAQSYPSWQLCIADDASTDPETGQILKEYAAKDSRIVVVTRERNGHIAAATNTALELAAHPWSALMDQDDELTPDALAFVAKAIAEHPSATLFFSDEDKINEKGELYSPYFKNGKWDWELIPIQNYVSHLGVYRTDRLRAMNGFREDFPGAQDHDLLLRYVGHGDARQFIHIPHVLYHWRAHEQSTAPGLQAKPYAIESADRAAREWLERHAPGAALENLSHSMWWRRIRYPLPSPMPSVSLICHVPGPSFPLEEYRAAWTKKASMPVELVFVLRQKDRQKQDGADAGFRVITAPDDASVIQCLRLGADTATGQILGFVDASLLPGDDTWLEEMVSCLWRPDVGAAGGKILHPDGNELLHGGYLADAGGLKRIFTGAKAGTVTWFAWNRLERTVDALDRFCLFTKAEVFRKNGGFNESMGDWGAQDYCLRLGQNGLRTVWWPYAAFVHLHPDQCWLPDKIEVFFNAWQGKLAPSNKNLLALGPGWQLHDTAGDIYDFSPDEYLRLYPDVGESRIKPLAHYLDGGIGEGRKGRLSYIDYSGLTRERLAAWQKTPKNGVVVCTSLCGNYERLLPPAFLNDGWSYVCYSDTPREGWGIWDIRPIPYENDDPRRRARWVKTHLPELFPDAEWVFWMDANVVIRADMSPLLDGREEKNLYLAFHLTRDCAYQEGLVCAAVGKEREDVIQRQLKAYREDGMPEHYGLYETPVMLLAPGSEAVKRVFSGWDREIRTHSKRDQVSLPYVLYHEKVKPGSLFQDMRRVQFHPAYIFLTHEETWWIEPPEAARIVPGRRG